MDRDNTDHFRFSPLQTTFAHDLCQRFGMPADLSTGILIEDAAATNNNQQQQQTTTKGEIGNGKTGGTASRDSTGILRMLLFLGFPYNMLGWIALYLVPKFFRDFCYQAFARNRGIIWKQVKKVTGMGDTMMDPYRDQVLGIENNDFDKIAEEEPSWGFTTTTTTTTAELSTPLNGKKNDDSTKKAE